MLGDHQNHSQDQDFALSVHILSTRFPGYDRELYEAVLHEHRGDVELATQAIEKQISSHSPIKYHFQEPPCSHSSQIYKHYTPHVDHHAPSSSIGQTHFLPPIDALASNSNYPHHNQDPFNNLNLNSSIQPFVQSTPTANYTFHQPMRESIPDLQSLQLPYDMNRNNSFYEPQTIPPISHYSNGTITEHERRTSSVTSDINSTLNCDENEVITWEMIRVPSIPSNPSDLKCKLFVFNVNNVEYVLIRNLNLLITGQNRAENVRSKMRSLKIESLKVGKNLRKRLSEIVGETIHSNSRCLTLAQGRKIMLEYEDLRHII